MKNKSQYSEGIAFILEGHTEKVFYSEFMAYCAHKHQLSLRPVNDGDGVNYVINRHNASSALVKLNNVGTVSQMTHSADWFNRSCIDRHPDLDWTVVLGYDTDMYNSNISKFHQGDWARLRRTLKHNSSKIIDMAAEADIEDIILCDYSSVLSYLDLPSDTVCPSGRKGKVKMKRLHHMVSLNFAYKAGEKARPLIQSLDWETLINTAPIPLQLLEDIIRGIA